MTHKPLLTDATLANLGGIYRQGLETVRRWQDPQELLTFRRRTDAGWVDVAANINPISVRLDSTQEQDGRVELSTSGVVRVWVADLNGATLQPDDRFNWQGHVCVINVVPPTRFDHVAAGFSLLEGN